jgi:hypothetical protein
LLSHSLRRSDASLATEVRRKSGNPVAASPCDASTRDAPIHAMPSHGRACCQLGITPLRLSYNLRGSATEKPHRMLRCQSRIARNPQPACARVVQSLRGLYCQRGGAKTRRNSGGMQYLQGPALPCSASTPDVTIVQCNCVAGADACTKGRYLLLYNQLLIHWLAGTVCRKLAT